MKTDLTVCLLVAVVSIGSMTQMANAKFFKKHVNKYDVYVNNGGSGSASERGQIEEDELSTRSDVDCTTCGEDKKSECIACGFTFSTCRFVRRNPVTQAITSCCICACFPSTARVSLENGKKVTMSELQIGDKVQTVSTNGIITYSEVKSFLKIKHTEVTMYKSLTTSLNSTMSLTGNHLIYSRRGSFDEFHPVYADQVAIGDEVLVQANDEFTPEMVINVSYSMMQGIYAPVTIEGNVVVDGVLASCYGSFDHDLVHILIKPIQWFPEVMEWIFGTDIVSPGYASFLEDIGRWALPTYLMY